MDSCDGPGDCCTASCLSGFCMPSAAGGRCGTSDDCESPLTCAGGVCTSATCRQDGDVCSLDTQCCADNCRVGSGTCGVNRAPVASAGPDVSSPKRASVYVDGNGSYDPDGDARRYSWTLSAPPGSGTLLAGALGAAVTVVPDVEGVYTVTVTVSDGELSSSDSMTITVVNSPPTPNAGASRSAPRNVTVQLDGSGSSDPDSDPLTYAWTLAAPASSAAALSSTTGSTPSFLPDVLGEYVVTLEVSDGAATAATSVTITAINTPPVARVTGVGVVNAGDPVSLSADTSSDANGDGLTFTWSLAAPAGSAAVLSATSGETTSFTTDRQGAYTVTLVASDGVDVHTAAPWVSALPHVAKLPHDVVDAAYSTVTDRILMVGASPGSALWIMDPVAETEVEVALPSGPPLSVAVSADGAWAAIGRLGGVMAVELATKTTVDCPITWTNSMGAVVPFEAGSVALGAPVNAGTAKAPRWTRFAFAVAAQSEDAGQHTRSVDVGNCAVYATTGSYYYGGRMAAMRPLTTQLYVANSYSSDGTMIYETAGGVAAGPTRADPLYGTGGKLWFHEDGSRMVTEMASVYASDPILGTYANTLQRVGELGNPATVDDVVRVAHAAHSTFLRRVTIVPGLGRQGYALVPLDFALRHYSTTTFGQLGEAVPLPTIAVGGVSHAPRARFVFYRSDSSKLYLIERTHPDVVPATFAVAAMPP
jgi:hypothetical protein